MVLRVGVIGLGDIARKAYLPVLAAEPDLDLERVGDQYRISGRHGTLDGLIHDGGVEAALVHAPTDQHVSIVERLLNAGVHTFVDKPLDYRLTGAQRLVDLASRQHRSLMVGFNRRYAPGYAQLLDQPRDLIVMQKNRMGLAATPRQVIFDDFIHVLDTLRFLLPGSPQRMDVTARVDGGLLHHVVVRLAGAGFTALGLMNRMSGSVEECLEVMGGNTKREVRNLAEIIDHHGEPTLHRRGDWVPVARQRGIEQLVRTFLGAVRSGTLLSAEDALRTHEMCERVVDLVQEAAT